MAFYFSWYFLNLHSFNYNKDDRQGCPTCQGGSNGLCAPDEIDCQALPWYRNDFCGGDYFLDAGKNGCVNCPQLRSVCATSCNWCTPNGVAVSTTTTTRPTTYSEFS